MRTITTSSSSAAAQAEARSPHHLAPSGKRILLLERGDWLPREPSNWSAADVFVENRYISPDTWHDAAGKPFQPQVHYFVGGATKLYGAALYRLRAEDFGELRHHGGISPGMADPLRGDGAVLHRGRAALPGARQPRRGPDRTCRERTVPFPGALARAEDPAALRRPRRSRPASVPRALRRDAGRGATCPTAAVCAARRATASRAWCTLSPMPRSSPSGPRWSMRT